MEISPEAQVEFVKQIPVIITALGGLFAGLVGYLHGLNKEKPAPKKKAPK